MGDIYRVTIVRENNDGEQFESETVLEVAGSAQRVARAVKRELDDLSGDGQATVPAEQLAAVQPSLADRVFDQAVAGQPVSEPVKRKRRTNAEIAADKAAVAAGYRDAAHQAEAEAQQQVEAEPVSPAEAPESVPAEPAPAATPAAPYNPFEVK